MGENRRKWLFNLESLSHQVGNLDEIFVRRG